MLFIRHADKDWLWDEKVKAKARRTDGRGSRRGDPHVATTRITLDGFLLYQGSLRPITTGLSLSSPSLILSAPFFLLSSSSATMNSLHAGGPRPMGPRTQRAASPAPPYNLSDVASLNTRKSSSINLREQASSAGSQNSNSSSSSLLSPPGASPAPIRPSLQIPGQSSGSRPKLKLPKLDFNSGEGPFAGGYAGGPNNANGSYSPHVNGSAGALSAAESEPTIRPQATISPQQRPPPVVSMENLRQTVGEFDKYSDDVLEELSRLGEGAGGAVYKVRDRRTGVIMARKTITTLEAPMKQLFREINIISSTSHINIIHFYGAYMSSSSSEVKVLMELGEGGSLESVGKQMKLIGGRVGEKVAGRLAEGVSAVL